MTDSDERPEGWKPIPEIAGCTYSGYEVSDNGRARSIDRKQGNRQLRGKVLASSRDGDGYVLQTIRCDSTDPDHDRVHTFLMHKLVLTTFDRPCPPGMEACHGPGGRADNRWPENLRWDTKAANHADMVAAGTAVVPEFPCVDFDRCGGMARHQGKRCRACVDQVGELANLMMSAGMPSMEVAERFGLTDDRWIHGLAREHGYRGTRAEARVQRPTLMQRAQLLGVLRLARRSGHLAR